MVSGRNWGSHLNNISLLWSHENVNPALLWPGVCWVRFSFFFSVGHLFFWCLCWVMNECCVVILMWFYTADTEITKANVPSGRCSEDRFSGLQQEKHCWAFSVHTPVTASLFLLLAVRWPDFPAGVCLAVEPADGWHGSHGWHCHRGPVENCLCSDNGCNDVRTGGRQREVPEKR